MTAYGIELRRSPLRWWFPLLVVVDLAALFGRSRWWIGEWPQTSAQAQIPAFYFASLLCASAAWTGGRVSRNRMDSQMEVAARPRWQVELMLLSATLTYGLAAYGIGIVVAAAVSFPKAGPGFLWPSYLLLGAALLVTFAGAGHVVGRLTRSSFAGPVLCGLGSLVFIAWVASPHALEFFVLNGEPFQTIAWPALGARCLVAVLLVVAACLLKQRSPLSTGRVWADSGRPVRAAVLVILLGASAFGLASGGPTLVARKEPSRPVCTSGTPRICLWPEDRKYLSEAENMANRLRHLPHEFFTVPSAFYEQGLRGSRQTYEDFYILEGSMWDPAATMASTITNASWPKGPGCLSPGDAPITPQYRQALNELDMWLAMRIFGGGVPSRIHGGPPGVDLKFIAQIINRPEADQIAWVAQRKGIVRHAFCG